MAAFVAPSMVSLVLHLGAVDADYIEFGRGKDEDPNINGWDAGSLKRWDRWHIIPQLALIYCLLGGYIIPTTF